VTRRVHLDRTADTHREELGDGDWVEIVGHLTVADRAAISRANRARVNERGEMEFDNSRATLTTLKRSIIAWGGPGFCAHPHEDERECAFHPEADPTAAHNGCKPLALNDEVLLHLDEDVSDRLIRAVNRRNPTPSTEEDANP